MAIEELVSVMEVGRVETQVKPTCAPLRFSFQKLSPKSRGGVSQKAGGEGYRNVGRAMWAWGRCELRSSSEKYQKMIGRSLPEQVILQSGSDACRKRNFTRAFHSKMSTFDESLCTSVWISKIKIQEMLCGGCFGCHLMN